MRNLDSITAFSLGASVLYALLTLIALAKQKERSGLAFFTLYSFLWMAWWPAWKLGWLAGLQEPFTAQVPRYGILLAGVIFLFLTRSVFDARGKGWLWGAVAAACAAAAALLSSDLFALPDRLGSLPRLAVAEYLFVAAGALAVLGVVTAFFRIFRHPQSFAQKNTAAYWLFPTGLILLGSIAILANRFLWGGSLQMAGVCLTALVIWWAPLPDIRRALSRMGSWLVLGVLAVALYFGVLLLVQAVLDARPALHPVIVWLVAALILVYLVNPFLRWSQQTIKVYLPYSIQDPAQILKHYSQNISNVLDLKLLAIALAETVDGAFDVHQASLFLVDHEMSSDGRTLFRLRAMDKMGSETPDPGLLSEHNPLVIRSRSGSSPFFYTDIQIYNGLSRLPEEERSWLSRQGFEIWVPILARDEWIGMLALGQRASGDVYDPQTLELLSLLAAQTAVALENVRLVEGLLRLNNEFRRAYTAMNVANRHLERLERTKSDFISIASHELRTPLTLIGGSNQMLMAESDLMENDYHRQLLSKIQTGADRLQEIVESMLDMAQIDTRALSLDPQPLSIRAFIETIRNENQKPLRERHQNFVIEGLGNLPPLTADRDALHKVFSHLVLNAIKYTPDGGEICVTGSRVEPKPGDLPQGGVEIVVHDTGIGIDPAHQQLIFGKFYQTGELSQHSTGKTKFKGGGPGLGLAIARGIIEAHGGKIWAESPGCNEITCPGSSFHVLLPLKQNGNGTVFEPISFSGFSPGRPVARGHGVPEKPF